MSTKKGLHHHPKQPLEPIIPNLTKAEKEILRLITEEHLNLKQIQLRRNCSRQAVHRHFSSLVKKGKLDLSNNVSKNIEELEALVNQSMVRLHGQEFNIQIVNKSQKYEELLKKSNLLTIEGHKIRLYGNSIEIYAGKGISFYGIDEQEAYKKSLIYWQKFFTRLEHELKVILVKDRKRNMKEVNHHYARTNSEICENTLKETGKKIRVFAEEDKKLCFITDESFGMKEDETVHPLTAKQDRQAIDKQVNDWRLYNPPTNSELSIAIMGVTKNQEIVQKSDLEYRENIKTHVESIKELGWGVKEIALVVKELKEEIKRLRDIYKPSH